MPSAENSPSLPSGDVPEQVVADRVHPVLPDEVGRGDLVDAGVGHLLATEQEPPVHLDVGRRVDAGGHAHGRPPHAVEPDDLLADQVVHGRPPLLEPPRVAAVADGRQVVDQGVVPDVEDVLLVPGDPHPPVDRGPGDGDVPEAALDEAEGLVALGLGHDGRRVGLVPVDEPLLEGAQAEEVVLLFEVLHRRAVDGAQARRRGARPPRSTARTRRSRGHGRCP